MTAQMYFNVLEDTRFFIRISAPVAIENVGENFTTKEELLERFPDAYFHSGTERVHVDREAIKSELQALQMELDSGKRSVPMDPELVAIMKEQFSGPADYVEGLGRRGDRLIKRKPRTRHRKQTAPMKRDAAAIWQALPYTIYLRYGEWPPHVMKYQRTAKMFEIFKKLVTWKELKPRLPEEQHRWCHMIWKSPKEYLP